VWALGDAGEEEEEEEEEKEEEEEEEEEENARADEPARKPSPLPPAPDALVVVRNPMQFT